MPYQKSKKSRDPYFYYQEVGAIADATQEQIEHWVAEGFLHPVHFENEHKISEKMLDDFIDRRWRGSLRSFDRMRTTSWPG